ncbi:MAG: hypothetical protein ACYDC7_02420 [Acidithiobacillus ferrivorans]
MKPLATTWCTYYAGFVEQPPDELLDIGFLNEEYRSRPFYYPMAKGNIRGFPTVEQWYDYVQSLRIRPHQVPLPYLDAFDEALRALFMTYLLPEFCKMAEMKALSTLEGALKEAYHHQMCKQTAGKTKSKAGESSTGSVHRCAALADCLEWAEQHDGLEPNLFDKSIGQRRPEALNVIRDKQMHGKLEEMFPWGGLFEVSKSTLEYAFRNWSTYDIHQLRAVNMATSTGPPDSSFGSGNIFL